MVFTDLPLSQEFKTLGIDDYLWVQALFNHEELERLRGVEPTDPHQRFLWRIIRIRVIGPEAGEKVMDASTRSMRHLSGPLPLIDMTRNPHQVSRLQQVHVSRVLGLERGRENKEKCQGCSLQLTGTRGLVGEGGVEGVLDAFGS